MLPKETYHKFKVALAVTGITSTQFAKRLQVNQSMIPRVFQGLSHSQRVEEAIITFIADTFALHGLTDFTLEIKRGTTC